MSPGPPGPVIRLLLRAPARLYDHDLGWILGKRFLCLTHVGRKSGRRYRTVLEVIGTKPAAREVMVIAGMGPSSDWYRNIQANPAIEVVVGRSRFRPIHRALDQTEAAAVVEDYERRNRWVRPVIHLVLSKLLGWRYNGSETQRTHLVRSLPIVALRPRPEPGSSTW